MSSATTTTTVHSAASAAAPPPLPPEVGGPQVEPQVSYHVSNDAAGIAILPFSGHLSQNTSNNLYKFPASVNVSLHEYHNHNNYNTYYNYPVGETAVLPNSSQQQHQHTTPDFYNNLFVAPNATQYPTGETAHQNHHHEQFASGAPATGSYYQNGSTFADYYQSPHNYTTTAPQAEQHQQQLLLHQQQSQAQQSTNLSAGNTFAPYLAAPYTVEHLQQHQQQQHSQHSHQQNHLHTNHHHNNNNNIQQQQQQQQQPTAQQPVDLYAAHQPYPDSVAALDATAAAGAAVRSLANGTSGGAETQTDSASGLFQQPPTAGSHNKREATSGSNGAVGGGSGEHTTGFSGRAAACCPTVPASAATRQLTRPADRPQVHLQQAANLHRISAAGNQLGTVNRNHHQPQPQLSMISRRKNATRETTATLKDWLDEHGQNPYPTKGEKIMLSIITKMSLNQVSTWFANARRRMKKENKVFWGSSNSNNNSTNNPSKSATTNGAQTAASNSPHRPDSKARGHAPASAPLRYFIHKHQKQLANASAHIMTLGGQRFDGSPTPFVYCRQPSVAPPSPEKRSRMGVADSSCRQTVRSGGSSPVSGMGVDSTTTNTVRLSSGGCD